MMKEELAADRGGNEQCSILSVQILRNKEVLSRIEKHSASGVLFRLLQICSAFLSAICGTLSVNCPLSSVISHLAAAARLSPLGAGGVTGMLAAASIPCR